MHNTSTENFQLQQEGDNLKKITFVSLGSNANLYNYRDSLDRSMDTFKQLGGNWNISEDLINWLEEFVCLILGFPRTKNVNEVRSAMLKKMVGKKREEITNAKTLIYLNYPPVKGHMPHSADE